MKLENLLNLNQIQYHTVYTVVLKKGKDMDRLQQNIHLTSELAPLYFA